jgi:hypothetical protein
VEGEKMEIPQEISAKPVFRISGVSLYDKGEWKQKGT